MFSFQLEDRDVEMCDDIYEVYTDLLQQSEEEDDTLCYKTYFLVNNIIDDTRQSFISNTFYTKS